MLSKSYLRRQLIKAMTAYNLLIVSPNSLAAAAHSVPSQSST